MTDTQCTTNKYTGNIALPLLFISWLYTSIPLIKHILNIGPIIFPKPPIPQTQLTAFIVTSILFITSLFRKSIILLSQTKPNQNKHTKQTQLILLLLICIPTAYCYTYETDFQTIGQMIIDLGESIIDEDFEDLPPGVDPPNWEEEDGEWATYDDDGNMVYYQGDNSDRETLSISTSGNSSWADYTIELDLKFIDGANRAVRAATVVFRYQGGNNHYILYMLEYLDRVSLFRHGSMGRGNRVDVMTCTLETGVWYHVKLTIVGDVVNVWIDDVPYFTDTVMDGSYDYGSVGIGTVYFGVMFDNINVTPIE